MKRSVSERERERERKRERERERERKREREGRREREREREGGECIHLCACFNEVSHTVPVVSHFQRHAREYHDEAFGGLDL